jgi:hypothetical protein
VRKIQIQRADPRMLEKKWKWKNWQGRYRYGRQKILHQQRWRSMKALDMCSTGHGASTVWPVGVLVNSTAREMKRLAHKMGYQ